VGKRKTKITRTDVTAALRELDELSRAEYEISLEKVLLDQSALGAQRMQRLTGIVLKKKFAKVAKAPKFSATRARRSWPWAGSPKAKASRAPQEFAILEKLRRPGPWNERKPKATRTDRAPISWDVFIDDVEHERGLFKWLALYVSDKVQSRNGKSIREYLESKESRKFEAGLDLSVIVFDAAVVGPLATVLGLPTVAVGLALVGIQFGYRKLTDPEEDRIGEVQR
jgi:hypothetical protein